MKKIIQYSVLVLLTGCLVFISCKKERSCENCKETNKPPIAIAGPDQVITLPTDSVSLNGSSSSDPDGKISEWLWTKISGPASFTIIKPTDSTTKVKALVTGIYQVELKITDNGGLSAKDTVQFIVNDPVQPNRPPVANAGPDQIITLPTNTASFDGSSSTDPDNNITSYTWTKISGPSSFNITNANNVQTQVTNLVEGIYLFELKVTDAGRLFSRDTIQVIVNITNQTSCPFQQTIIGTLPAYRYAFHIEAAGNKIVFAGGFEVSPLVGSLASSRVDIYDVITGTWTSAELSNHGGHIATVSAGDKIFFAGGTDFTGNISSSKVDIYNASDNTWTTTNLSEPRSGIRAVKAGNKVLFAGGGTSTKVDIYDLSLSSWITSFNLSQVTSSDAIALGNKAVFGITNGVEIYDALSNSWSTKTFSQAQTQYSPAAFDNKIYLAGGYTSTFGADYTFSDVVHIYDVITNTWSTTTMSQPKALMTAVGRDGKIFWAGGFDSAWADANDDYVRLVNDIEIYQINTGSHSHHFFPSNTYVPQVGAAINNILFTAYTPLHIYNVNSESWTICPNLGWGPTFISRGNTIYAAGPVAPSTDGLTVWKLQF
jgi:hypothetical protein